MTSSADWLVAHLHKADGAYAVLVLALAFLLGSFAAGNTDLWMHLATGRLVQKGEYQKVTYTFGVDPFAYMTEASRDHARGPVDQSFLAL